MDSCTIFVLSDVEAPGLKLYCKLLEYRLSNSLVKITTFVFKITPKLSEFDTFAHQPLEIGTIVSNKMSSADKPCHSIIVSQMARRTLKLLQRLIMWPEVISELPSFLSGVSF